MSFGPVTAQCPIGDGPPTHDHADAAACVFVVIDERVMSPQLDCAGQLAPAFIGASDRFSRLFVNGKHG
jgi:hypothetical protein